MVDDPKNITETAHRSNRRDWRRPELQRLAIAATSNAPDKGLDGDEGHGQGKGDAATIS